MAAGTPVLGTSNMRHYPKQDFFPNLYSDMPAEWLQHLKKIEKKGITIEQRERCYEFASCYSWDSIASDVNRQLKKRNL